MEGPGLPEGVEHFGNIILVLVRKMNREEHLASQEYQNESWRSISYEPEKINSKKREFSNITGASQKTPDDNQITNKKRQKILPTQDLNDNNNLNLQNNETNGFSSVSKRRFKIF